VEVHVNTEVMNPPTRPRSRRRSNHTPANEALNASIRSSEIAHRAHELFVERGSAHGYDIDDWLRAEKELLRARAAES
jgi:hypothetical protein